MAEPPVKAAAAPGAEPPAGVDFGDLQGLVRFGHGRLSAACFLLLEVADRAAAHRWLQNAPVTSALKTDPPPDTALQVAFTREGLENLGVPEDVVVGSRRSSSPGWRLTRAARGASATSAPMLHRTGCGAAAGTARRMFW